MILTLFAFVMAISVGLVSASGYLFALGMNVPAYITAALGGGWLGIVYAGLIREVGEYHRLMRAAKALQEEWNVYQAQMAAARGVAGNGANNGAGANSNPEQQAGVGPAGS